MAYDVHVIDIDETRGTAKGTLDGKHFTAYWQHNTWTVENFPKRFEFGERTRIARELHAFALDHSLMLVDHDFLQTA
jgi:hypothetical protein